MRQQFADTEFFKRVELNVAFPDGAGALYVPLREGVNCA